MRLLLDTVTFIWAIASPERISSKALRALTDPEARRELSSISISEIAIKQAAGKLALDKASVQAGVAALKLRVLAYTAEHAYSLFTLPRYHNDPFDRQLLAQAKAERIPIVTPDEKFFLYEGTQILW